MSRADFLGSVHHARHFVSSEELLDGYDCRIKTMIALRVCFSTCVLMYMLLRRDIGGN